MKSKMKKLLLLTFTLLLVFGTSACGMEKPPKSKDSDLNFVVDGPYMVEQTRNLVSEYKEVSERSEFMSAQVDDVEKSKKEILALIGELTKKMKDSFIESFSMINKHFGTTFTELFGGGTARLVLTDPEDTLNSGIDISVHPPGKIVTNLDALSGGEKALVAIALYFAIMKVRPSLFCVMDEIEAALDEVNVYRFADYIKNYSKNTQFIVVTHRRGTMEAADVIYGVTMQEKGVSTLLELNINELAE